MQTDSNLPAPTPASPVQAGSFSLGAALVRVLPSLGMLPFNFAPVGGLAVFAGARVRGWLAYALPLAVMVATDLFLWTILGVDYSPLHVSRPVVYASFLLYVLFGRCLGRSLLGAGAAALLGSSLFFLTTNFASWIELGVFGATYAPTLEGLLDCFVKAIPFHQNTLIGDVAYTFLFFGLHVIWIRSMEATPAPEVSQS